MIRAGLVWLLLAAGLASSACLASDGPCATSRPLPDGQSETVEVEVVAFKIRAALNVVSTLDVNGGRYTTPYGDVGIEGEKDTRAPTTDIPVGTYEGRVSRDGDNLTLVLQDQSFRLEGPQACD